ncbi:MAG: PAS domain-containing protein, partial [Bacteroidales bacterium]
MTERKDNIAILRQKAEELLKRRSSGKALQLSEIEMLKLIHELDVHQIELEMQNEELLHAKEQLAKTATDKYAELYDFAPSGYFTLSKEGKIIELNLSGASMLGKERLLLRNSRFGFFVSDNTRPIFNLLLEKVFSSKTKETCEVTIINNDNFPIHVFLTAIAIEKGDQCLLTVVDITGLKKAEQELIIANKELVFQNHEKTKRADELIIANKELAFQNQEKVKRAAELIIANKEIAIQTELNIANTEKVKLAELYRQALGQLNKIANLLPGVVYQYLLRPDGTSCFPYASEAIREIYRVSP